MRRTVQRLSQGLLEELRAQKLLEKEGGLDVESLFVFVGLMTWAHTIDLALPSTSTRTYYSTASTSCHSHPNIHVHTEIYYVYMYIYKHAQTHTLTS